MLSIIKNAFIAGYASSELSVSSMFICIAFTAVIAAYICVVYKMVNTNSFYDRNFHLSLFSLAIVTAAIILTIQSNIVVSLGMVGALSIVRFRTAIKNPMDLVYLFWSISAGIICGAGYAMIGIIASIVLTMGILIFSVIPSERETLILVVNASDYIESEVLDIVSQACSIWKVRARNVTKHNVNMAIEVKVKEPKELINQLCELEQISSVSLVEHDGEVTL